MKKILTVLLALFLISSPVFATVSDTESPVKIYSGTATTYTIPFGFIDDEDVLVTLVNKTTGVETAQTKDVDYTISGTTVTYSVAPGSAYNVILRRETPFTQEASFSAGEAPPLTTYESAYDKLTYLVQDLDERLGRSILLPQASTVTDIEWPDLTLNAGKLVRINTAGTALEAIGVVAAGSALDVTAYCDAADLTALNSWRTTSGIVTSDFTLLHQISTSSGVTNADMTILHDHSADLNDATATPTANKIAKFTASGVVHGAELNMTGEASATSATAYTDLDLGTVSTGDRILVFLSCTMSGDNNGVTMLSLYQVSGTAVLQTMHNLPITNVKSQNIVSNTNALGVGHLTFSTIVKVITGGTCTLESLASVAGSSKTYSNNQIYVVFLKKA